MTLRNYIYVLLNPTHACSMLIVLAHGNALYKEEETIVVLVLHSRCNASISTSSVAANESTITICIIPASEGISGAHILS